MGEADLGQPRLNTSWVWRLDWLNPASYILWKWKLLDPQAETLGISDQQGRERISSRGAYRSTVDFLWWWECSVLLCARWWLLGTWHVASVTEKVNFELYWLWPVATVLDSRVQSCPWTWFGGQQRRHHLGAWEKIQTFRSHSKPAFWQDIPGYFCVHWRWLWSGRPRSLPSIILWFSMEENKQSFGKEWQESGLQSERAGLDAGEFPDGVVVRGGASCEASGMRRAEPLQRFRCSHPRGKLRIYHRTCLACSTGQRALIGVLLDDPPPHSLGHFRWLGTAENTHLLDLAKFRILPTDWKITFVLLFWIKHILFYPLGLRWLLFLFSISPSYSYFSSSCQGCYVNPFLLVLIVTCIFLRQLKVAVISVLSPPPPHSIWCLSFSKSISHFCSFPWGFVVVLSFWLSPCSCYLSVRASGFMIIILAHDGKKKMLSIIALLCSPWGCPLFLKRISWTCLFF